MDDMLAIDINSFVLFQKISKRTFIYDVKEDSWSIGPSLSTPRHDHISCAITSDDGSTQSVIIIGGRTNQEHNSKTTEVLNVKTSKWVKGPDLPTGIWNASCVALPPTSNFACVVVGGSTEEKLYSSDVYGLSRTSTDWTLLGTIRTGRFAHIALPLL